MNAEILSVLIILLIATIFLVFEWIPAEITALLVLVSLTLSGVILPFEAIWDSAARRGDDLGVFILSGGLTRTGVGDRISRLVLKFSGRRGRVVVLIIMSQRRRHVGLHEQYGRSGPDAARCRRYRPPDRDIPIPPFCRCLTALCWGVDHIDRNSSQYSGQRSAGQPKG